MLVRSVARVGISLLGLWLAAIGVASLGDVVGSIYELERDAFVFSVPGNAGSVALIGVVAILAFRIAPADPLGRHGFWFRS